MKNKRKSDQNDFETKKMIQKNVNNKILFMFCGFRKCVSNFLVSWTGEGMRRSRYDPFLSPKGHTQNSVQIRKNKCR